MAGPSLSERRRGLEPASAGYPRAARTAKISAPNHTRGLAAKPFQAKPNRTKQNSFDLLGFIRANRDFSMGYGESK
jgi:hypothetical protein